MNAAFPNYLTSGKNDELGISFVSYISSVSPSPNWFLVLDLRFVPLPTFTILQSDFAAWMVSARRIWRHEGSRRQPGSNYQTVTLIFWAKSTNTILYLSLYSKPPHRVVLALTVTQPLVLVPQTSALVWCFLHKLTEAILHLWPVPKRQLEQRRGVFDQTIVKWGKCALIWRHHSWSARLYMEPRKTPNGEQKFEAGSKICI